MVLGSKDADISDHGRCTVGRLQFLKGNVFAIQSLDQVFLAINNSQMAVGIELSNITRLEPSVIGDGFLSLLLIVPITFCYRRSTNPDFALRWLVCREITGGRARCSRSDRSRDQNLDTGT